MHLPESGRRERETPVTDALMDLLRPMRRRTGCITAHDRDEALAQRKLTRRIALRAPFLSAVRILASSDMVSVLPRRVAEELVRYRPLAIQVLPFSSTIIKTAMIWPRWLDNQPAHSWLRGIVAGVSREQHAR